MEMDNSSPKSASYIGKAGEHAVAAQLLLRGMNVYFPSFDTGRDMISENGCRIQVKSGHLRNSPSTQKIYKNPVYTLHMPKSRLVAKGSGETYLRPRKPLGESCDVVVFWGVDQNRFWVIPSKLCDAQQCVVLGPDNKRTYDADLKDIRELRSLGFSTYEIARHYNVDQSRIWNRLQKPDEKYTEKNTFLIRACENAWHHIIDFGQPAAFESQALSIEEPLSLDQIEEKEQ
jgi:hypothetical protein